MSDLDQDTASPDNSVLASLQRMFDGAGDMAPLLHAMDWASTSLGPVTEWPQSLRSAASICFGAKYPIAIYWGPDLTLIYNEAWSVIPADKHPWALGRPAAEVWPDIWHIVGPEFDKALAGEGMFALDRQLPMQRRGFVEETYFNYNLSPIVAEDGLVAGVFNAGIETTDRVLAERRQQILLDLTAAAARTSTVRRCATAIVQTLAEHDDEVPFAQLHLSTGDVATLEMSSVESTASLPTEVHLDGGGPDPLQIATVARTRSAVQVDDIGRLVDVRPSGDWPDPPTSAVVIPIVRGSTRSRRRVHGALVVGLAPGLVVDAAMRRFHESLGDAVAFALHDARRDEEERRQFEAERRIATTLQQSLIPTLPDLPSHGLYGRYVPGADGVEVGGDWYDALELAEGCVGLVIGDVVGKGVAAAAQMGQLSNATRAYMLEGYGPGEVLGKLNRLTRSVAGSTFATVLCLHFDSTSGTLRWARAGHLPPMVRRADGSIERLDQAGSAPVGVFDDEQAPEWEVSLRPGDALVLYTDGLIERRGEDIDVGMDRLAASIGAHEVDDNFVGSVFDEVVGDQWRDDVAILVLHV